MSAQAFDAERAFFYLEAQCAFGPRNPGSAGHEQCLDFLVRELNFWADTVFTQPFEYHSADQKVTLKLANVIARFAPEKSERVLLCAHWDTRPVADRDPKPENRSKPIIGANDGASGVAVLLEMARQLYTQPAAIGVDIVLFDGEDFGREGVLSEYLIGSEHFAQNLPIRAPRYAILLDMVGDRELSLPIEPNSQYVAPQVIEKIYTAAERQKAMPPFVRRQGTPVMDDHLPLIKVGIPAVDLIDFDYPYWHTLEDVPERCSAQSLGAVGRTVLDVVYSERITP